MDRTILILHLASRYRHRNKPFWRCSSLSFSLALKYFDLFFGSPSLSDPESTVSRCWVAFLDILWFEVIPNLLARVGDFSANALKLLCMRAWSLNKQAKLISILRENAISFVWKLQSTVSSFYCQLFKPYFEEWNKCNWNNMREKGISEWCCCRFETCAKLHCVVGLLFLQFEVLLITRHYFRHWACLIQQHSITFHITCISKNWNSSSATVL